MSDDQVVAPLVVLSFKDRLVAINAHTGERAWEFETGKTTYGQLRVEQGRVLYIAQRKMICLSYSGGELLWELELPHGVGGEPNLLVYAGCVVVMGIGEAASITLQDGSLRWHDTFKGYGIHGGAMAAPGVSSPIDRRHP